MSVTVAVIGSPGLNGLVSIVKPPLPSVVPLPISLPSLSVITTRAFGSSDLPVTIPLSALPSAGLLTSTGVTVVTSTVGGVVSV